jgi:hypothetical protein
MEYLQNFTENQIYLFEEPAPQKGNLYVVFSAHNISPLRGLLGRLSFSFYRYFVPTGHFIE